MIVTQKVTKYFQSFAAVREVSFTIPAGEIVGFLGQNGAGKTTLMRILASFLPASSGRVFIDGEDLARHSLSCRAKIGYLPETPPLYTNMTVEDYLRFAAEIKGVPVKQRRIRLDKVLAECQLTAVRQKVIGTLSKGYKQRVGIAQAIVHEPRILILDEPTSGLDPIQVLQVRALIKDLRHQRTVLLSTHILSEIEQIAHRVLIMRDGQLIVDGPLGSLLGAPGPGRPGGATLEEAFVNCHQARPEGAP
ncbi:MAG: ABC transporter ATP-binding protein [Candidatus Omnitrophica bacterium]|nr:ABC transporter ATP-binding protein [Candidatus Omnitrophota bacterium]